MNLGRCYVIVAELWEEWEGLQLARANGFNRVLIHTDCLKIYQLLRKERRPLQQGMSLQSNIKTFLRNEVETRVIHIY